MHIDNCEGIVLGLSDYRESDKIVTLFTREHGKLKGIARGAKRSVKRFGGCLELFARLQLQIVINEGLSTIRGADTVTIFPRIREDLLKIGYAGYACELTDRLTPEGMANSRLFRLLSAYLEHLNEAPAAPSDRRFFEVNLLNILGYRPTLDHCYSCGADLAEGGARYAATAGGLLCGKCGRGGKEISAPAAALLNRAMHTGRFGQIRFSAEELVEAGSLLDAAIASHLNRPLNSLLFLQEL